jgi:hypothetical protein
MWFHFYLDENSFMQFMDSIMTDDYIRQGNAPWRFSIGSKLVLRESLWKAKNDN